MADPSVSAISSSPSADYIEWAQESLGVIVHHPLRLGSAPGKEERGVYCEQDIPADTIVVSVPWEADAANARDLNGNKCHGEKALLTLESARGTPFEGLYEAGAREDDVLCLLLLYHCYVLGKDSPLSNHIRALPRTYHQTIFYSEEEMVLLRGTSLHAVTERWKFQVDSDIDELMDLELELQEGVKMVRDALEGYLTKESYLWALSTVWSRFVTVERGGRALKAMAPMFDMFNHDPLSSTVHGFQETNQCLHLVTLQNWRAGCEVRFCYGPLSNSRLLLLHGFCVPDNPFDAVELWATMEERAPRHAEKTKILAQNGVDASTRPFLLTKRGLDPNLLPTLRVQHATGSELKVATDVAWGEVLSQRNEAEVCDALRAALSLMLKDREAPSDHSTCNGSARPSSSSVDHQQHHRHGHGTEVRDDGSEGTSEVAGATVTGARSRWISPEDRRKAVELLKSGEERVILLNLEWIEAHQLRITQQLE